MPKTLILTIFSLLSLTIGIAQDVSFGVKIGINLSSASQEDLATNSITSFHLGGIMEARYTDKIALQPEILYSFQGFDYIVENNVDSSSRLSYINVPVMFKYYVIDQLSLEAGPQIGFLSSAKLERTTAEGSKTTDVKDSLRSNDLSFNIGFSYYLFDGMNLSARYCYGLTNIVNRLAENNFKNRVLQLSVGYFF